MISKLTEYTVDRFELQIHSSGRRGGCVEQEPSHTPLYSPRNGGVSMYSLSAGAKVARQPPRQLPRQPRSDFCVPVGPWDPSDAVPAEERSREMTALTASRELTGRGLWVGMPASLEEEALLPAIQSLHIQGRRPSRKPLLRPLGPDEDAWANFAHWEQAAAQAAAVNCGICWLSGRGEVRLPFSQEAPLAADT